MKKVEVLDKDRRYRRWTIEAWEEGRTRAQEEKQAAAHAAEENHRRALRKQVLAAALLRCQDMGDGNQARQQMHRDVRDTPDELLPDLLQALADETRTERARFEQQFDRAEWRRRNYQQPGSTKAPTTHKGAQP